MFIKIYLFVFTSLLFNIGFAQSNSNLKVNLSNPTNNATIQSMQNFVLKGYVVNLGPDALTSSDSLALYLIVDGDSFNFINGAQFENFKALGTTGINLNDTFFINMPFAFSNTFDNQTINFCLYLKPLNRQSKSISDSDLSNNSSCATISITSKSSTLQATSYSNGLTVNSNPMVNSFILKSSLNYTSLILMDCMGRATSIRPNDLHQYDVSQLSNGVYTLIISDGITSSKTLIIVQH